ncbi:hypothetical protein F5890DRAFT_1487051 [Lentinula detonsa]|uniref:Uncharacterized protein n=1 Tax=Lentinula detonsa TaxID=2804962 RepID=A0AA38UY62_9AGAR|nr:hypothetical protein F5890DRAFT_1487051 [Lentinula detonsa]
MILSLRSLCAAFLLWTSCSVIAMPVGVQDQDKNKEDKRVKLDVSLVRKLNGEVIDQTTSVKLNSDYSVFKSTGSPSVRSPEEWLIQIGSSSWQAKSSTHSLLKAVRIEEEQPPRKRLLIGKVNFDSWHKQKRVLDRLVKLKPGGKFEYTMQIIATLKIARVWKKHDGGYKRFESMYEQVQVPI